MAFFRIALKTLFCLLILLSGLACTGSEEDADEEELTSTLSSIQTNIFTPNCAKSGCHSSSSASGGLDLSLGSSFKNLVDVASTEATNLQRVEPRNASNSYLINKLEGTQSSAGGSGVQMPKGSSALTSAQIQSIKDWINAGAQNN
ncbi:MAG: hypothetical protein HYW02_03420 [Deltaproteobacteria bacterium]|nr:hypothetical protein [Deltaproteobacteria bacterium]MBI2500516.1 hypothetical protein [Deltaproteobacteria bacterium]